MKQLTKMLGMGLAIGMIACNDGRKSGDEGQSTGQRNEETIVNDTDSSSQRGSRKAIGTGEGNDNDSNFHDNGGGNYRSIDSTSNQQPRP
jgi:hypothetical protein